MYRSPSMTISVHSPFWMRAHRSPVWITPREYALVASVQAGWVGNQRALAKALGYSLAGLNEAISTLAKVGVLARSTTRGRLGRTRLRIQAGVHVLRNVRSLVTPLVKRSTTTTYLGPNISPGRSPQPGQSKGIVGHHDPLAPLIDDDWLMEWAV